MTDGDDRVKQAKHYRLLLLARFGLANLVGAVLVFAYFQLLFASRQESVSNALLSEASNLTLMVFLGFLAVIGPAGYVAGAWAFRPVERWLASDRPPTADERKIALAQPAILAGWTFIGWALSAVVFAILNASLGATSRDLLRNIAGTLLSGLACAAICFLLSERYLRPVFGRVLEGEPPRRPTTLGITPRLVLSWALGSAVPLLGIALAPLTPAVDRSNLFLPIVLLALIGIIAGGGFVAVAAKSVAEPIDSVRAGLERVQRGDLDTTVPVDDGGEIGLLQAGFNRMASGLREREQLRDLFGRHVGEEVARQAVEQATGLGGEQRNVSVLFVDLVSSTAIAQARPPTEVVAASGPHPRRCAMPAHGGRRGRVLGAGRRRQRGRRATVRVHGDRGPGERGRPPHRGGETAPGPGARQRGRRANCRRGVGELGGSRGLRPARTVDADRCVRAGSDGRGGERLAGTLHAVVVHVVMGDEPHDARRDRPRHDAFASEVIEQRTRGRVPEDHHVRRRAVRVAARVWPALGDRPSQATGPLVVVGQALDHRAQGDEPRSRDDAGLSHATAETLTFGARAIDDVGRAGEQ